MRNGYPSVASAASRPSACQPLEDERGFFGAERMVWVVGEANAAVELGVAREA